jgi:serine phosphatase RsbU (regulator of sigma subunit)
MGGVPKTQGERLLLTQSATFADMRSLSRPTLTAMGIGTVIVLLDGAMGTTATLIPLLAVAPVVAALSASRPETGVVGIFCVCMAVLSGLWNSDFAGTSHLVNILVVGSGAVAGFSTAALRERLERGRVAEGLLAEAGTLLESELDQARRAERVAEIAVPVLADAASVYLRQPDGTITHAAMISDNAELASVLRRLRHRDPTDPGGNNPVAVAIRTGEEQFLGRVSEEELREAAGGETTIAALRRAAPKETIVVPLRARGLTTGAIKLSLLKRVRSFDSDARRVIYALAERCALAIDNARVHQEQAHIASVLQRSLLPESLPEIAGFELASRFLAAGEANQVGGDFYDVFRSGKHSWTIVIGDVCGKGPEAAALTALARHTIRAAESPEASPSEVLARLHDSIRDSDAEHRFCTAVLARVVRSNGRARLDLTIGGHPSPLAIRSGGAVEPVGLPGTLLGGLDHPNLADATTQIRSGETLVLFTDGLLESRDRLGATDLAWPEKVLTGTNGDSAQRVADRLLEAALKRQGGVPRDDIAVVVLRRSS